MDINELTYQINGPVFEENDECRRKVNIKKLDKVCISYFCYQRMSKELD